jgi:AP-4 complex subunit beta-1
MIRALGIRTLCSVNHEAFVEHHVKCILAGLKDDSSYVRRTAVLASLMVHRTGNDHQSFVDSGLVHRLYELIRDSDPVVVVDSLMAIEEILKSEGGIVLNKKIVGYLLSRVHDFTPSGISYFAMLLHKYKLKSEDEIFDMMNVLDSFLEHNSITVCINILELFLILIKDMPHLKEEVFQRSVNVFLSTFSSGNCELITTAIQYCNQHADSLPRLLASNYKTLFCKYKDPAYLKVEKLQLIVTVIEVDNFKDILEEIVVNCHDKSAEVSLCAIQCLGKLVLNFPDLSSNLMKAFQKLLKSEKEHVLSNTLQVLVTLSEHNLVIMEELGEQLCTVARKLMDSDGKSAALYLIAHINIQSPEVLYVIEDCLAEFNDLDLKVKGQLLLTCIRLFCRRSAEFQTVLGELFELCLNETDNRDLVEQTRFYYTVLESNPELTKQIFIT